MSRKVSRAPGPKLLPSYGLARKVLNWRVRHLAVNLPRWCQRCLSRVPKVVIQIADRCDFKCQPRPSKAVFDLWRVS
jgi:hypothetical protein